MDILNPSRLQTFAPQRFTIVEHIAGQTKNHTIKSVYPFTTLYSLKQRISLLHKDDANKKQWLPSLLFVAEETTEGFKPVEFVWSFTTTLQDPLDPMVLGKPDRRIYSEDGRLPIFPQLLTNATIENTLTSTTLHVWSFVDVAKAAGYGAAVLPQDDIFQGFFQLYWPTLSTTDGLTDAFAVLTPQDASIFSTASEYIDWTDKRYTHIEAALTTDVLRQAKPVELRELRRYRATLEKKEPYTNGGLELLFYQLTPSATIPFLRYFPSSERVAPLVKIASTATGLPLIDNPKLLEALLADEPVRNDGGILLLKAPVQHPRAPLGTTWTLRIMEDGSAELSIGAPRKDAPLPRAIVQAAVEALPRFLDATPWASSDTPTLVELNAIYEFTSVVATKPSRADLRARLDTFMPFFAEDTILPGSSATLALRFKAVSNFSPDSNPIDTFITTLFLRDEIATMEAAPIAAFVGLLTKEFGISAMMAGTAIQSWINKNAEFITTDKAALATKNLGSIVSLYNSHPKYLFHMANIESLIDLQRVLTLLTYYTNATLEQIRIGAAIAVPPPELPPPPHIEVPADAADEALMDFELAMMGMDQDADAAPEELVRDAEPLPAVPVVVPLPLAEGETIRPIEGKWYLKRLEARDGELFKYTKGAGADARVEVYSRACQRSSEKQPHVMAPETYARARTLYGDAVFWVEAPLSANDLLAVSTVSKSAAERDKNPKKSIQEVISLEKRALSLGFPLKKDQSITTVKKYETELKAEDVSAITTMIREQKEKPLWIVIRAGSNADKPNYYICAEFWCVRDDLPIIPREFASNVYRDGRPKAANSCPFCGGSLLTNPATPQVGETVLRRERVSGKLAEFAGIQKLLYHPDRYALPCCFVGPDDLVVPEGAQTMPPPKVPLPPLQQAAPQEAPAAAAAAPVIVSLQAVDRESRDRPFTARRSAASANRWYLPNQNVLGRTNEDWFELEQGAIAVPPKSVNKLLGQDPEKFLTAVKGAFAVSQNSYLAAPGSGFVRYGLGSKEPGNVFLSLIAYAQYVSKYLQTEDDNLIIATPQEVLAELFSTKEPLLRTVFPSANYGTLLHEFSMPGYSLPADRQVEFQSWWGSSGLTTVPQQRAYAENLFMAYTNFKDYLGSTSVRKDLRLFESMFAVPGLFTTTGFLIVRIVYPKSRSEPPTIVCPTFGVSVRDQSVKPPLLFVLEDQVTGLYDPLVFYEGKDKDNKLLLGLLQTEKPIFGRLGPIIREALGGFIIQYYGPVEGCGRSAAPIHPWMPVRDSTRVPLFGTFVSVASTESDVKPVAQLRDRSNRLVGVAVQYNKKSFYIPTLDDGSIMLTLPSLQGEEALPRPQLQLILEMLMGLQIQIKEQKLVKLFPGLLPTRLIADTENFVCLELACGAWVPFEPFSLTNEVKHRRFAELRKSLITVSIADVMPWDLDIGTLRPHAETDPELSITSEEVLNESYQHLRISFSKWLNSTADGNRVRSQIELLRQARKRLPLYELQKRLDLLLTSIIANPSNPWMTRLGKGSIALLRRDCRGITTESACTGGCSWSGGRCLIHTTATERYIDPIRVCIARLTDELLRSFGQAQEILHQRVPYLRSMDRSAIVRSEDALLFSVAGRGTSELFDRLGYSGRKATEYTQGLTYPEEVDVSPEDSVSASGIGPDWESTLQAAVFAAPIQRDRKAKLNTSLVGITGKTIQDLEAQLEAPFTGLPEQWKAVAVATETDVLLTKIDPVTHLATPHQWFHFSKDAALQYIIVDPEGIPLQVKKTLAQVIKPPQLPATVRLWMDAHNPEA